MNLQDGDTLVQLGDKNDRGKDTYNVFEYFRQLQMHSPQNVVCLWGNHEDMMMNAADTIHFGDRKDALELLRMNGGEKTARSYVKAAELTIDKSPLLYLGEAITKVGHRPFLKEHYLFLETEDYFFSHAPIPKEVYRRHLQADGGSWQTDKQTLIWSYHGENLASWVDPEPVPGKIAVYGHIHGLTYNDVTDRVEVPGIRQIGNAFLIDTGCGCAEVGYLTCLELPAKKVYTSRGEVYEL